MRRLPIANCQLSIGWGGQAHRRHAFGILVLVLGGCAETKETKAPHAAPPVVRVAADGPVTMTFTVSPSELSFHDRAEVTIEVTASKDVVVEVDEYDRHPDHLQHQFEYRLSRRERQAVGATPDGKRKWTYRYDVQFFLPGEYELPGPSASFTEPSTASSPDGQAEIASPRQVKTEPITVSARDPSAKAISAEELKTIATLDPVELPGVWSRWWWVLPLGLAALIAAARVLRRRRERVRIEPPIPAHEWARRQIGALVADDLVRKGLIQEFYYRASGIVRGYIERRFGITAAEMTTEEFLTAAATDTRFDHQHTPTLQTFMTACDLVKYARQIPHAAEADEVLKAAGGFVEKTREDRVGAIPAPRVEAHAA